MSDIPPDEGANAEDREAEGPRKSTPPTFSRNNPPRTISVTVGLPKLLSNVKFTFRLRLALSKELQDAQEALAGQPEAVIKAAQKTAELDEVCDLLQDVPEGFGDWPTGDMRAPGVILREYVTSTTDPEARFILDAIIRGADRAYWGTVTPREFPAQV